ncbi:hypothetical protein G7062_01620 [Erysipelothrix sp. HDW6C]|uniref:hypothetical protein n=1 Tax=Erysipelothrix sp. HDW6C TaxID=2714930 RepID=UPI00140E2A28|nr:hypothetical protein [Erysipelothrix sp. HDW6C]QIK69058.1 hypothetical protein G7062_01620 [Erysipelothrix sp. HDW6C]
MKTLFTSRINFDLIRFHFKRLKALTFVFTVLLFTTFPIPVIIKRLNIYYSPTELFGVNAAVGTLAFITMGLMIIAPFIFFHYLFSSRAVDVYHALPIRRRDLFITYIVTAALAVLIPFALTYFTGYILTFLLFANPFTSLHIFTFMRLVVIFISISALTVFVIMNTGTLSDAIIYTGILSIAPFVAYAAIQFFAGRFITGFASGSGDILPFISPHLAVLAVIVPMGLSVDPSIISSYWFIISIIIYVVSIWLYERRRSERTEEPFTNRVFFSLITSLFTAILLVGLIAFWSTVNTIDASFLSPRVITIPILLAFVVYVLLNIIKNRSTRKFKEVTRNYAIMVVTTLVILSTFYFTNGFGFTERIPDSKDIESIQISESSIAQIPFIGMTSTNKLILNDPESIRQFVVFHEDIVGRIDSKRGLVSDNAYELTDPNADYNNYVSLEFAYVLTNGSRMSRAFLVHNSLLDTLLPIAFTTEVQSQVNPILSGKYYPDYVEFFSPSFSTRYTFTGKLDELVEIYRQEISNYTVDDYTKNGGYLKYILAYGSDDRIFQLNIDERHTRTLQYLETHLIDPIDTEFTFQRFIAPIEDPEFHYYNPISGYVRKTNVWDISSSISESLTLTTADAKKLDTQLKAYAYSENRYDTLLIYSFSDDIAHYFSVQLPIIPN